MTAQQTAAQQTDEVLLRRLWENRDTVAEREFYNRWSGRLLAIAFSILKNKDDATDCVQDTFIQAALKIDQLRREEKFSYWIKAICRNMAVAISRKKSVRAALPLPDGLQASPTSPFEASERKEEAADLKICISRLSITQQKILKLHFGMLDGTNYSLAEIAVIVGKAKSTVKKNVDQALDRLLKCMTENGY